MEALIVICLVIVIVLLLQDKIVDGKRTEKKAVQEKSVVNLSDIMGLSKPAARLSMPSNAIVSQIEKPEKEIDNFDIEIGKEDFDIQIPQEELDDFFGEVPNLEEEEDEWYRYRLLSGEDGFATGVTFQELGTVGMLLQQEKLESSQEQEAAEIVHKIQGTELFSLLENSMENASRKIAVLLNRSIFREIDSGSSSLRKNNLEEFDIGEFI
ncbi:conjugal transfer protein TraD [Flavobacterium oncorhynchi]|uniref:Conjugal transfer protein TraD n=1 Tax=Flavobacterium oncorhynchi TaxID=728056 RepID=A0A226HKW4_9FLAO|nr:conjugal transfer protein TraD [Flavobacterium oncorhynchi]OXA94130.1 conjugal transfer protein TraD [Flavobacterium oncorhynchi]